MSYKSELNKFKETFGNTVSLIGLDIAMEVEDAIENSKSEISEDDYESICDFVYQVYMKDQTDRSVYEFVESVFKYLKDKENSVESLLEYSLSDFLYYINKQCI